MPKRSPAADAMRTIALAPVLDLKAAASLQSDLLAARGQPIQLDASQVQRLGGLCLQVLLSAEKTWKADGTTLEIVSPSIEFRDGAKLLGASSLAE